MASRTIPVEEAVGMVLPHDVTRIVRGEFKGAAFKKGHIIRAEDVAALKDLGKNHIYVLELGPGEIHENEAAALLASSLAGRGVSISGEPVEGKLNLVADQSGLLKIDVEALYRFNLLGEVMCATLHTNTPVEKGQKVAGTRLIPLVGSRRLVEAAAAIGAETEGVVSVHPLPRRRVGLVITGSEVFHGRIKDAFAPVLSEKIVALGSEVVRTGFAPDDIAAIAAEIAACLEGGAELVITSGGMSVDPDDVTRLGIAAAGATAMTYGTPVLPGAMFMVSYLGEVPVLGLPACGMFSRITVLDLLLPRLLLGEKIGRPELAALGHGGLCRQCQNCRYPICDFGR